VDFQSKTWNLPQKWKFTSKGGQKLYDSLKITPKTRGFQVVFNHTNFHLYHYAGNNPIRYTDPKGLYEYEVQAGDTLSQMVQDHNKKYNTNYSYNDIALHNGIKDPDKIKVGQKIDIPIPCEEMKVPVYHPLKKSEIDNGSFTTWYNKVQGEPLTPKEQKIQMRWGVGEMVAGPVIGIGACEASCGLSVEIGLYIMADGAVMITKAKEGTKQVPFMFFANLKSPSAAEINGVPVNTEIPNPAYIFPGVR